MNHISLGHVPYPVIILDMENMDHIVGAIYHISDCNNIWYMAHKTLERCIFVLRECLDTGVVSPMSRRRQRLHPLHCSPQRPRHQDPWYSPRVFLQS